MKRAFRQAALSTGAVLAAITSFTGPSNAAGTARIQQADGSSKVYKDVYIRIKDRAMALISRDGKGRIVLGKAACTRVGELIRCLPYDAMLEQFGETHHVALKTGTVWFNPSGQMQTLSYSTTKLPPRGVLLSVQTTAGTFLSLSGIVDEVKK